MAFDIVCCHSLGIHGNDFFFHILCDCILIFFYDLRFKLTFPITWNIDIHITIGGMHGFLGVTVSTVVRVFVPVIVFTVAKIFVHFLI